MRILSTYCLLALIAPIVGCGKEPASVPPVIEPVAYQRRLDDGMYEIQLRYSVTTSGGPCLNKSFFSSTTSHATNWLYVKSIAGTVNADQIVVTIEAGKRDYPYAIKNMRGAVSFDNGTMKDQMERPKYPDGVHMQGYAPYYLNGMYRIAASPNSQSGAHGRQPSRSETNQTPGAAASRRSP